MGWVVGLLVAGDVLAAATRPLLTALTAPGAGPDAAVAAVAALAGWVVLAWLVLGVVVALAEALGVPAARHLGVLAPRAVRVAVQTSLGVALVTGVLPVATAHAVAAPPTAAAVVHPADDPEPWPSLDRPAGPVHHRPSGTSRAYVVVRGDSLWTIAARHLRDDADPGEIAAAWPRWWQANRATIGDDPDEIRPGQVLHAPGVRS